MVSAKIIKKESSMPKKLKIAFVNSLYYPHEVGGAEKAVRTIAEQNVVEGGESVVIALSPEGRASTSVYNGVKIYYVPLANIGFMHAKTPLSKWQKAIWYFFDAYNPFMRARISKILREEKPDVVETNNLQGFSVSVWKAAKALKIPVVQVLHDYYLSCINSTMFTKGKNCKGQCLHCKMLCTPRREVSNIPAVVSSVSRRTYSLVHGAGMFPDSTPVVYGSSAIKLNDLLIDSVRPYHKAGEPVILGFLGRIDPLKGIDVLLEAMHRLPEGVAKLLIAGGGNEGYVNALKEKFSSPAIEFLGVVPPQELFSKIHLLLVPSVWEDPLPRVIAESHACAVPVAISKIGGMPEIVEDGVTGYYFDSNQPNSIATLVKRLHGEEFPTESQREKCLERTGYFNIHHVMEHHKAMWDRAFGSS